MNDVRVRIVLFVCCGFLLISSVTYLLCKDDYKTQTVLFRNIENDEITVELQWEDIGARGYNRRIVKVTPGFIFDDVEVIDTARLDAKEWKSVYEDVNELGLKGP